jgi:hypothetical protein
MTPNQTPENITQASTDSVVNDKIVDTSLKTMFTDASGEVCLKRVVACVFSVIGLVMGLVIFYKGLSNPEADYIGSVEIFQFFIVSGLAGLGLSTVEGLFKKK